MNKELIKKMRRELSDSKWGACFECCDFEDLLIEIEIFMFEAYHTAINGYNKRLLIKKLNEITPPEDCTKTFTLELVTSLINQYFK